MAGRPEARPVRAPQTSAQPRDPDELSEEVLDLVTGGMGPQIAVEHFAKLINILGGGTLRPS